MLALLTLALAAPAYDDHGLVLVPPETGPFLGGINAPSVEWDGAAEQFVMYFESAASTLEVPEDCYSYYRIGRATSPDGQSWTIDESFSFEPDHASDAGSYRCAATQPAVLFDGATWHLFFTGGTTDEGRGRNEPSGILHATSADGLDWSVAAAPVVPPEANGIGLASATLVNGTIYVVYSQYPHLMLATAPASSDTWTLATDPVIDNAALGDWAGTWAFGPSIGCTEEGAFTMTFGGDSTSAVRTIAAATSADAAAWTVEPPVTIGSLDSAVINHWDVLAIGGEGSALWYSRTDETTGLKAIGLGTSGDPSGHRRGRSCPDPWPERPDDTGDTGGASDTGDSGSGDTAVGDSGEPGDEPDTGDKKAGEGGCGCQTAPGAGLASLVLVAFARRRR